MSCVAEAGSSDEDRANSFRGKHYYYRKQKMGKAKRASEAALRGSAGRIRCWRGTFPPEGSWVMVWRKPNGIEYGDWTGPGILQKLNAGDTSCYVDVAGRMWKCPRGQVRPINEDEGYSLKKQNACYHDGVPKEENQRYQNEARGKKPDAHSPARGALTCNVSSHHRDDGSFIELPNWRSMWPSNQWTHLVRRLLKMRPPIRRGGRGWRQQQYKQRLNEALKTANDTVSMN